MEQNSQINFSNPEAITYHTEELGFTILGGIRIEGLDRLRVTLKIEVIDRKFKHYLNSPELANLAIRHNIDLYNDTQLEKLIRKTAERLEVGSSSIAKSLAALINQLEQYRLNRIEEQQKKPDTRKPLTEEERQSAIDFLQQENLLEKTNEAIGNSGVIGEELNRLLMYIIFTSRKREHPLHVVSLGSSGTGKTYLQEKVAELIPEEDKLEITVLSENAFYYFGQRELQHKLILIEDLDGAENVLYPLRELQSKKRISKTVAHKDTRGNTKTISLTVEGPVSVAGCTTKESIYEDNANRSFLIYLDESPEQDEKIMQYQRKRSAGNSNTEQENNIKQLLQNTQRILQPITIKNPFAELLQLPQEVFKPRRSNSHYLQFIEAITFYHQYQREQQADEASGEIYINTTIEDIAAANSLIKEILLRKSDELNTACRRYFEYLKAYLKTENKTAFTAKEVRQDLRINHSNQKRYMLQLLYNNYIKKSTGAKAKGYMYEVVSMQEYETLKNSISKVLDDVLEKIKTIVTISNSVPKKNLKQQNEINSLPIVQQQNEPLEPNDIKEKSKKFKSSAKEVNDQINLNKQ
jgi:predicted transcriptional regulator